MSKFVENWQSSENIVISIDIFRTLDLMKIQDWFDINNCVVLREPVANRIKYLSKKSSDQNDQSKSKWE